MSPNPKRPSAATGRFNLPAGRIAVQMPECTRAWKVVAENLKKKLPTDEAAKKNYMKERKKVRSMHRVDISVGVLWHLVVHVTVVLLHSLVGTGHGCLRRLCPISARSEDNCEG